MAAISGTPSISQTDYNTRTGNTAAPGDSLDAPPTVLDRLTAERSTGQTLLAQHQCDSGEPSIDLGQAGAAALGTQLPLPANRITGSGAVQAEIAANILENVADGRPAFRPELGQVGQVSWFVTDGNPYTASADNAITLPVDIDLPPAGTIVEFRESDLVELFENALPNARALAEQQFRGDRGMASDAFLNSSARNTINRNAARIAERTMWEAVGNQVASSRSGVGQVFLDGSQFSKQGDGVFTLTNRASNVRIQGGPAALLDIIRTRGVRAEPQVVEAAEQLVRQGQITGRLEGVFRVGGRVLIVAGVAADAYNIYTADDRVRETVKTVGGWAGAAGGVALYNAATGPTNVAGPWAWAANAVGNVVSGGVGYWAGSEIVEIVYDLAVDGEPTHIPAAP